MNLLISPTLRADTAADIRLLLLDSAEQVFTACHKLSSFSASDVNIVSTNGDQTVADLIINYEGPAIKMNHRMSLRVTFSGTTATDVTLNSDSGFVKPSNEVLQRCKAIINRTAAR
ncbi:MAG: hypothetical protein ACKPB4_24620 [Sphaerospermopsis kisseleviana]